MTTWWTVKKVAERTIAGFTPKSTLNFEKTNHRHTYSSISELTSDIEEAKIKNFAGELNPNSMMICFASVGSMRISFAKKYVPRRNPPTGIDATNPATIPFLLVGDQLSFPPSTNKSHTIGSVTNQFLRATKSLDLSQSRRLLIATVASKTNSLPRSAERAESMPVRAMHVGVCSSKQRASQQSTLR